MTCRIISAYETGIANPSVAGDAECDTISTVASGTLTADSINTPGTLYALKAATGGSSGTSYRELDWGSDDPIIYLMARVMFPTVPSAITAWLAVTDSTPTQLFSLRVNASGFWQVQCNANSTTYTSTLNKPVANTFHRIEFKFDITNGALSFKIDGQVDSDLTKTGLTLGSAKPRRVRVGVVEAQTNAPIRYMADLIVNEAATSPNNSWVGKAYVRALHLVSTDASGGNWTVVGGLGNDYGAVYIEPWDTSTSRMIKSSTGSQEDRMVVHPLGTTTGPTIIGLCPMVRQARNVAGNAAGCTINIRSGSTDGTLSSSFDSGSTTFKTFRGVIAEVDPATSAAWALTAVNSAILRIVKDAGANQCNVNGAFVYIAFTNGTGSKAAASLGTENSINRVGTVLQTPEALVAAGGAVSGGNWRGGG